MFLAENSVERQVHPMQPLSPVFLLLFLLQCWPVRAQAAYEHRFTRYWCWELTRGPARNQALVPALALPQTLLLICFSLCLCPWLWGAVQTKVASCELLHAVVTTAVGFYAQGSPEKYLKLFASLFPCVFRLAVDGDPVSNQLFQPLVMQLIHWFTTKTEHRKVAVELLNAILEGLESKDNGKLREASSKFLAEFIRYTLRVNLKNSKDMEEATTVKDLLYRIYGLLNHPSAPKRLGAYLAVKQFASILRQNRMEHARMIDQFLLELLHNCIMSLRICHHDHQSMGTTKAATDALRKLGDIMRLPMPGATGGQNYAQVFLSERSGDKKWPRRTHKNLESFANKVYEEVGAHDKTLRRYCMDILPELCKQFPGERPDTRLSPRDWIRSRTRQGGSFAERFEHVALREAPGDKEPLRALTKRYACLEATMDVYSWLLRGDYARPSDLFVAGSVLVSNAQRFVHENESVVENGFKSAMPSELRKHKLQRSKCIYALLKLVCITLSTYSNKDSERAKIPRELASKDTFRLLFLSVLAPGSGNSCNDRLCS